jgi:hypothetical protein
MTHESDTSPKKMTQPEVVAGLAAAARAGVRTRRKTV